MIRRSRARRPAPRLCSRNMISVEDSFHAGSRRAHRTAGPLRRAPRGASPLTLGTRATALLLGWSLASSALALEGRVVLKASGQPVADAHVSLLGRTGSVPTDAQGRFVLTPSPSVPFDVLIALPGGRYLRPIRVERLPDGPLVLEAAWHTEESVTVTEPVAPETSGTPANGLTLLSSREMMRREPASLAQALESVAGASTVSEGQAAVPALRGLSAGRILLLIDGARVSSERRAGPSASYLDPVVSRATTATSRTGEAPKARAGSSAISRSSPTRTASPRPRRPAAWTGPLSPRTTFTCAAIPEAARKRAARGEPRLERPLRPRAQPARRGLSLEPRQPSGARPGPHRNPDRLAALLMVK